MKDKTIHFRVSTEEYKRICDSANREGCTVSKYAAERVLHQNQQYNPSVMVRLENIRRIINEAAFAVNEESKAMFNREVDELWKSLNW